MIENKELKVNDEFKYSKEDICSMCGVDEKTFRRFMGWTSMSERDSNLQVSDGKDFISIGSSHKKFYTEDILKRFQLWLMKNQINQGVQVETVKETGKTVFQLGALANIALTSGNIEAAEEFSKLLIAATTATAQAKELEAKNQLLLEQKEKAEAEKDYIIQCNKNFHNNLYTATEIANKLGITPNKVGRIANENGLKNDPIYGKLGKIRLNNGQWVNQFYYNDDALTVIESILDII